MSAILHSMNYYCIDIIAYTIYSTHITSSIYGEFLFSLLTDLLVLCSIALRIQFVAPKHCLSCVTK